MIHTVSVGTELVSWSTALTTEQSLIIGVKQDFKKTYRDFQKPIHLHGSRQSQRDHQSAWLVYTVLQQRHQTPNLFPKHGCNCSVNKELHK